MKTRGRNNGEMDPVLAVVINRIELPPFIRLDGSAFFFYDLTTSTQPPCVFFFLTGQSTRCGCNFFNCCCYLLLLLERNLFFVVFVCLHPSMCRTRRSSGRVLVSDGPQLTGRLRDRLNGRSLIYIFHFFFLDDGKQNSRCA